MNKERKKDEECREGLVKAIDANIDIFKGIIQKTSSVPILSDKSNV